MTATGLVVLLLAIIGIGVGLYYAYICLRARPLRPESQPTDSEHGPLIAPDPDVNGNHEDVPLEASAPVDDEDPEKLKKRIDEPDTKKRPIEPSNTEPPKDSKTPNGYPKEKEEVFIPVKEELTPAKVTLENETVPVINHAAPIGLVAPLGLVVPTKAAPTKPSQPTEPEKVPSPKKSPAQTKKPQETHPPTSASSPAPVYVPVPIVAKKPVSDSDEEDGLLLPKCSPHDDSLDPDQCPELTPAPEQPKINPSPCAEASPDKESKPALPPSPQEDPSKPSAPEDTGETPDAAKPEITIAPNPAPEYGWKEDTAPVKRAPDTPPISNAEELPVIPLMKEEVENLQPVPVATKIEELDDPVEPIFEVKDISNNLQAAPVKNIVEKPDTPQPIKSNDNVPVVIEPKSDVPTESSDDSIEYPPVVYLETCQPSQDVRPISGCSGSSEEVLPPYPQSDKATPTKSEERRESPETPDVDDSATESIETNSVTPVSSSSDTIKAPLQLTQVPIVVSSVPVNDASDVPLEAYIPNLSDDDNSLAVIKEEGSTYTESETESSEPEVTEYSFSSGPTAPTTSEILADEVSCSMEPEVTKYSIISDAEERLPSEESESSDDEVPVAVSPKVDEGPSNPKQCEPDSSAYKVLTTPGSCQPEEDKASVTASSTVCTQLADSTNVPSNASLSSSGESEDESEGAEAELELREEIVEIPRAAQSESCESLSATSSDVPTSTSQTVQSDKSPANETKEKKNGTLVCVADSADSDISSTSSSSSSPCTSDLSDDEVTTSTPKKSKIPRLVSHQESSV